ncbi:MAG: glycosyltransferase family 4 protein [Armatimonadetes bacterium]|nr:glycosyltransferase family 4 protein [Armatimonadota bacterium]
MLPGTTSFVPLRIVYVMRSPVGGLFRHVVDLSRGMAAKGHEVGIIADDSTGGDRARAVFQELEPELALGVTRIPMGREVSAGDLTLATRIKVELQRLKPDVVHGHGAKGGAFARLPYLMEGSKRPVLAYTPHGGSLHYKKGSMAGRIYFGLERMLFRATDLLLFESEYARTTYDQKIGLPNERKVRVIYNGLRPEEFEPLPTGMDALDLVLVGELVPNKGVDILIEAVPHAEKRLGRRLKTLIVGAGKFEEEYHRLASGHSGFIFSKPMPAREAFSKARLMILASRNESLPYIVLEAIAAKMPVVATRVGGVPEIFGPDEGLLVDKEDPEALGREIAERLDVHDGLEERLQARAKKLFRVETMVEAVEQAYFEAKSLRT